MNVTNHAAAVRDSPSNPSKLAACVHSIVPLLMTLIEYDCIWAVTYESLDDGHRLVADYFTTKSEADTFSRGFRGVRYPSVVQTTLWHTPDNPCNRQWYKLDGSRFVEVLVDRQVYRKSGLAKLSPQERRALGV